MVKIKSRKIDATLEQQATEQGLHPLLARIIAGRTVSPDLDSIIKPSLAHLDHPFSMQDMDVASKRLAKAIIDGEIIGIETDHDCDGQTSHAVLFHNLVEHFGHPRDKIKSYIGHRLTEGYGLSESVANRILEDKPKPSLVITADNGSSDEPRIARLQAAGIETIVTDHHQLPPNGPPKSALACLNPTREDCKYQDPFIAGCMVAWLLTAATRVELIKQKYLAEDAPKLLDSLDYVAVGTVADCVSLARSANNRAVVSYGLRLINKAVKPCWQAILNSAEADFTAEDLGFKIGPLLNSDGRLDSAFGSVSFLLAENIADAREWLEHLELQNSDRKQIQKSIINQGYSLAAQQVESGKFSICIYLLNGHPGVHGIAASRIKEKFGRPTVFLAPKNHDQNILTGSIRGIENFSVVTALQNIAENNPDLFLSYGGHRAAGGLSINAEDCEKFADLFEQEAQQQLNVENLGPVILTDGELPKEWINLDIVKTISQLEPYGREFEQPLFESKAVLQEFKTIGDGTHARVVLNIDGLVMRGVWFSFRTHVDEHILFSGGENVICAFNLTSNAWGGIKKCELQVAWLEKINVN